MAMMTNLARVIEATHFAIRAMNQAKIPEPVQARVVLTVVSLSLEDGQCREIALENLGFLARKYPALQKCLVDSMARATVDPALTRIFREIQLPLFDAAQSPDAPLPLFLLSVFPLLAEANARAANDPAH